MGKNYLNRKPIAEETFKVAGTFESMYAAQRWIKERGYSYGSNSAMMPTAIMKGNYYDYELPHKWKNFTQKQMNNVHGLMTGDMREGPVFVKLFE